MKLSNDTLQTMKDLTQLMGVSGDETEVSRYLSEQYHTLCDEVVYDNLGSVFGIKRCGKSGAPLVLLAGHMDEVGFVVKTLTSTGCLAVAPIGGWWSQTLLGQRITLKNRVGKKFQGTVGSIPPHLLSDKDRSSPIEIKNMLVDIGAKSKEELTEWGISAGDSIVLNGEFEVLEGENRLLAKAWDNRYGCIMGLEVLKLLKNADLNVDLAVGATVQEEVGLRGAVTAGHLIHPDAAIIFDCSPAKDASGDQDSFGQLGKGPLVRFIDANYLPHRGFLNHYLDVLKTENLPYQYYQSLGGTDAGAIHKLFEGILTLTMCICSRNIHTNSSIIDVDDFINARSAAVSMVQSLNPKLLDEIRNSNH